MYEILNGDKNLADRMIKKYSDMMFAGVISGNNPGKVWVDDQYDPASAIVWSDGLECFQFMGSATNQVFNKLGTFINSKVVNFLRERKLNYFEYACDTEDWYTIIHSTLSDREIKESWQHVYKSRLFSVKTNDATLLFPYRLYRIDEFFISSIGCNMNIINPQFLTDYIEQFWGSVVNYLNCGYGYAALYDDKIVSFAIASAFYEKTFAIGVETLEEHRSKGLAGTMSGILINMLCEMGFDIWWDCMDSNIASQKTAERAGLIFDHKYKVCWFNF